MMSQRILFTLYIVFCLCTAYRTLDTIASFLQCEEEEISAFQSVLLWMGVVEQPAAKCPSTFGVFQEVVGNNGRLIVVVLFVEIVHAAIEDFHRFRGARAPNSKREETEALYFMENAMKYNGHIMIVRVTKAREQTFRFDPSNRKFKLILSFPREEEEGVDDRDTC